MRQHMAHALSTLQNTRESATKRRMYVYQYVRTRRMCNVLCFQHYALLELVPFYGLYTWWRLFLLLQPGVSTNEYRVPRKLVSDHMWW